MKKFLLKIYCLIEKGIMKGDCCMKKIKSFSTLVVVLFLVVGQLSPLMAFASLDYDQCDAGDHEYVLIGTEPGGYGGTRYFNVSSCQYASYQHRHYCITCTIVNTYACIHCGHIKTVEVRYDDVSQGEFCTVHDTGR